MKFIHTADIHIGMENYGKLDPQTGLSNRLSDFLKAFDRVVATAVDEKVDAFVFSGDAYKTREPSPTHQREFASRILAMASRGIQCVLLVGNHDTPNAFGKASSLDIYDTLALPNVHVISKIDLITIPLRDSDIPKVHILGIPWQSRRDFESLQRNVTSRLKEATTVYPLIISVHASIEGATYGSEQKVMLGQDFVVPKKLLLNPKITYVAAGHIHQRQVLSKEPPIVYAGSIERIDFGEYKEEKSFEIVTVRRKGKLFQSSHTHRSTNARKMVYIETTIPKEHENPTEYVLSEIAAHDIKDAIVKLVLHVSEEVNKHINIAEIKRSLRGAFSVSGISRIVQRRDRKRTLDPGVERLTPIQALGVYLEQKGFQEEKKKTLQDVAKQLLENE